MNTDRSQALFFLMSLGALPACVVGDDGDTDASTDPTTTPTSGVDTSGGMTMTTAMTMTTDPTGTTDPSTSGPDPDTGSTSVSPDTGSTSGGYTCGAVPEVCNTFATKYVECYPKYGKYQEYAANACACAIYYGSTYGENCATAYNDLYACLSALSCEDFMARDACATETAAVETECAGGTETTSTGG